MKETAIDLLKTVGWYLLTVCGGTTLFLILTPLVGYLPYSDRPGPGWHTRPLDVTLEGFLSNASYMLSWGAFLALYAAVVGVVLFAVARGLEWLGAPRWTVAVIGAILSGVASGYIVLGIGWYIAISSAPAIASLIIGTGFGAFLLPSAPSNSEIAA